MLKTKKENKSGLTPSGDANACCKFSVRLVFSRASAGVRSQLAGVGAVSVVAFTYEIYTIPSQNNGVLGATLTANYV